MEDFLHDLLARGRVQKVNLRRVVPRHSSSVVVDVARVAGGGVNALETNRAVVLGVVVVLKVNRHAGVVAQIHAVVCVLREGIVAPLHEQIGLLHDPLRVHARVVRHHVRGKADSALPEPSPQIPERVPAAEVVGNFVVVERIGGGRRLGVSAHLLYRPGSLAPLPQSDEPQPREALVAQQIKFLVGNLVEAGDFAVVFFGELEEPDEHGLRHEDDARHPLLVGGEPLVLAHEVVVVRRTHVRASAVRRMPLGLPFLAQKIHSAEQPLEPVVLVLAVAREEQLRPVDANIVELLLEVVGRIGDRLPQECDEVMSERAEVGLSLEEALDFAPDFLVVLVL